MKKHKAVRWFCLLLIVALGGGCSTAQMPPTPQPAATAMPEPTRTPPPTPTLTPSPAPEAMVKLTELQGDQGPVYSLAWSPDGRVLATAGYARVHLWDMPSGKELDALKGHQGFVWGLAWSPAGGHVLASGSADGTVRLWDATTHEELAVLETGAAFCVTWSPPAGGSRLAVGDAVGGVQVWDVAARRVLHTLKSPTASTVISIGWSPDGGMIASGELDGDIYLWDPRTGEQLRAIEGYTTRRCDVNGLSWSPLVGGRVLATAHQDGRVRLWDPESGEELQVLSGHGGWVRGIAWSPDGRWLASTGQDLGVRLWDAATGQCLAILRDHKNAVWSVGWSPDGRGLATGDGAYNKKAPPGRIVVWTILSPPGDN